MFKSNETVTISVEGTEFVGKYVDEDASGVNIKDPRVLVMSEKGMGFARGICITGKENPDHVKFYFGGFSFITATNSEIEKAYYHTVSGIVLQ